MSRSEILTQLKSILDAAGDLGAGAAANADESTKLLTELGLSSVSMLFLVIAVEEDFGIQFDDVSVSDFETVGDVIDYIERKLS